LYYDKETQQINEGYLYQNFRTKIYECMIPPLLRFFHIQKISPSGWIEINTYKNIQQNEPIWIWILGVITKILYL